MKIQKILTIAILIISAVSCSEEDYSAKDTSLSGAYNYPEEDAYYGSDDKYTDYAENPFVNAGEQPISSFAIDADGGSYSNTRRYLNLGQLPPASSVRVEEFINYFQFNYESPNLDKVLLNTEISTCPWAAEHHLMRIGLKGAALDNTIEGSNFVFLIDVSGSMSAANKLDLLKSGFKLLVDELGVNDRIAIVTYAGSSKVVLSSTSCDNKQIIKNAIDNLSSGGSTAGAQGIATAYQIAQDYFITGGNNRIIIGTDGDYNVGPSSDEELVELIEEKRELGIYLTVLGVGQGNLNDSMLEKIANHGNGNYEYIDNVEQLMKVFVYEKDKFYTVATDSKIQVIFDSTKVDSYRLIGYENRVLTEEEYENDSTDAGEIGANQTITALYEVIFASDLTNSEVIARLDFKYEDMVLEEVVGIAKDVLYSDQNFHSASENQRFAACVAGFGMLLKNSEYAGELTYSLIEDWAETAVSYDPFGFRDEFIDLVGIAKLLD
jgi:Ca-activated chloride channel family protein